MSIKHPLYRLNPARSIHVIGKIDRDMLSRVTPQILKLQAQGRGPITVYIDSPGGSVTSMETLLSVLRLSDQDSSEPCQIITAVTTRAASAAADLLSSGDYAIAFPHSSIIYHGVRIEEGGTLTTESSSRIASVLRRQNDLFALELARKIDDRFSFRFIFSRRELNGIRVLPGNASLSDSDAFIAYIDQKLSPGGRAIWARAKDRHSRYIQLFGAVMKTIHRFGSKPTPARIEAVAIKAIADFEVRANKDNAAWSFRGGGIERLAEDFALFNEYMANFGTDRLQRWSAWGQIAVHPDRLREIEAITEEEEKKKTLEEEVKNILRPLASFFAALCHALQEGENELTAEDAYWLGMVDEVVGRDDLLCQRYFEESEEENAENDEGSEEGEPS